MKNKLSKIFLSLVFALFVNAANAGNTDSDQLQTLKLQLQKLQKQVDGLQTKTNPKPIPGNNFGSNIFNPQIGLVLNGKYIDSTNQESHYNQISGFPLGDETAHRDNKGFSLGETELSFASNIDNLFRGVADLAIADHGDKAELEIEQAYFGTTSLPYGLNLKAGRMLADIGYLNSIHAHHDNFTTRPLPYQVFLDGGYKDDGAEASLVLPTLFYLEFGGGIFSGNKFPGGSRSDNNGAGAYSSFLKTGGDVGSGGAFIAGISYLESATGKDGRDTIFSNNDLDETLNFKGKSDLYIANLKYSWSPNGNNLSTQIILQAEYLLRKEDGIYFYKDSNGAVINQANFDGSQSGWYGEIVYKFLPKWRAGYRYSKLNATNADKINPVLETTPLNSRNHNASSNSYMIDFTNSEFSRIRFEYTNQKLITGNQDEIYTLQYIMVIGAHPAHKF